MPRYIVRLHLIIPLLAALAPVEAFAEGKVLQRVETYAVRGTTGLELYRSIGEHGPVLGASRAIAHTGFRLTWKRDYQQRGAACVLASAIPTLVITTVLPEAKGRLPQALKRSWDIFLAGVTAHEAVHAGYIRDLARDIEKATVGLTEPNDPGCRKIRQTMQPILGALSTAERRKQRDFDKESFADGGQVHQLILALVNGP
ncbi:DUF922 domain-containing Zn-dependent protease [Rhizobium halophytocola]|uniref:Secreted Zn-dependent protease n=1 Tax=Rhizobium halophytocola TaxID=735519 RepID=A0ABS4DYW2_9HYPH|nr:DUF922 domain-containing protein [Rhizobium halophytocola]MBP1850878.1 putative secreted Zn-dependent protease [Rhizobium halophytocola]